jgi:hypothetical protein
MTIAETIRLPLLLAAAFAGMVPAAAASFAVETVDSSFPKSGFQTSLVVDAQGVPHVSYFDQDVQIPGSSGPIRYASRSGSGWVIEEVDNGPVNTSGNTSLALDSQGRPHMSYALSIVIGVGTQLKYAHNSGGGWVSEVVDSGAFVSFVSSLALDAQDRPHLCYIVSTGFESTLYHAVLSGGTWVREVVNGEATVGPGIVRVGSDGVPRIVFKTGFPSVLQLAMRQPDGTWTTEAIDGGANLVATGIAFVLDANDRPHVSYYDYNSGTGKYAEKADAGWVIETTPVTREGSDLVEAGGLAVANDGTAFVCYIRSQGSFPNAGAVRLATRTNSGWTSRVVESTPGPATSCSAAVDVSGNQHLAYYFGRDSFSGELHYAHSVPASDFYVDPAGACGGRTPCFATIQAGIDAARAGDRVLVGRGTYVENVDFHGKAVTVAAEQGPLNTVIDGNRAGPVITFARHEDSLSVLVGFTVRNGWGNGGGGGIKIQDSSPSIVANIVIRNGDPADAGGIAVSSGSPLIAWNLIAANAGATGGGIGLSNAFQAAVVGNVIFANVASNGGGIDGGGGAPIIFDNFIVGNTASSDGGAIRMLNGVDADIVQNLIAGNRASRGGGIAASVPFGTRGPLLVSNTIADNNSPQGSGAFIDGFDQQTMLINNIIVAAVEQTAVLCGSFTTGSPAFRFNDVFARGGTSYAGNCIDQTGLNGNISVDPLFVDQTRHDYHLQVGSPAVDVGDNAAPRLPPTDLGRDQRVVNGVIDMGAYELQVMGASASSASHTSKELLGLLDRARSIYERAVRPAAGPPVTER